MSSNRNVYVKSLDKLLGDIEKHVIYLQEEGVTSIQSFDAKPDPEPSGTVSGMKEIARRVAACRLCRLHEKRSNAVPGQGSLRPDIMFVGEGPGRDEDERGLAFIGAAGKLLTKIIEAMGYCRDDVFIANVVKCRPPDNRKPLEDEMAACLPFLKEQINLLRPKTIVTLGATALEGLVGPPVTISRQRGHWLEFEGIPLMPTFHPSYLLRNQSAKKPVWEDMKMVLKLLGRAPPAKRAR